MQGSKRRGSVMIVLKLDMPAKLSRNEKKRISSMSDILGSDPDSIEGKN